HPHRDMEIISIPLSGGLEHKDSMGTGSVIRPGEVQIMSAGTGVRHSEYNASETDPVNFLQIWILPEKLRIPPRYGQKTFDLEGRRDRLVTVVAPDSENTEALPINQQARFSMGRLSAGVEVEYEILGEGNGVYVFVIDGALDLVEHDLSLERRDAAGLTDVAKPRLRAKSESSVLLIDVPMS
ncbi:MAG: pirin family protein, partial [Leptospirales bacterium]